MSTDTPQRILREKLREKRAEVILEVAEEILIEKGYHGASMDEIAARAGVAKGTLYQHFPTKEDLFFALIEQTLTRFELIVQQAASSHDMVRIKLRRILQYVYLEQQGKHAQLIRLIQHNEDLRARLLEQNGRSSQYLDQISQHIGSILEEGKATGLFDPTIATELMVITFLRLLSLKKQEYLMLQNQISLEALVAQVEHMFFEGIVRRPATETEIQA